MPEPAKPPTLDQLTDRHLKLMDQQLRMMEGLFSQDFSFGGSDILDSLLKNVTQADGASWAPINIPNDRAKAANWPFWRTQQQLDALRQKARVLVGSSSYAGGFLRNVVSHVIGKGGTYLARQNKAASEGDWTPIIDATQKVIDDHLKRNRWNCGADPRVNYQAAPTREQEIVRRTFRDGDCFCRAFLIGEGDDRGRTVWRFAEPSAIRNGGARDAEGSPVSCTEQDGWDYGVKHRTQPYEDMEDIEAYRVEYLDKSLANKENAEADAEIVPAAQMVHVKNPDEDAMIGRGTPFFSYDTWDAFYRAGRLETAITIGATIRACTAEYWEYQIATQAQITGMAAGLGRTKENPQTGQTEYIEARGPGMVRHGPANRKLVPPVPGGVDENINALQSSLRKAASAGCSPEYMVSADASNANYSSTKEAGTPFVRWAELLQEHFKAVFLACVWKAVRWAVECGVLPPQTLDVVEITVDLPKVWQRDGLQVAQEDAIGVQSGWKDRQACSSDRGLDPEQVERNNAEWADRNGGAQGMQLPTGGEPKSPFSESLESPEIGIAPDLDIHLQESGFSGTITDKAGHKITYSDGKRVKGNQQAQNKNRAKQQPAANQSHSAADTAHAESLVKPIPKGVMSGLASVAGKAFGAVGHVEHLAKEWIGNRVNNLPEKLRVPVVAVYKASFVTFSTVQHVADRVAKERGCTDAQRASIANVCGTIDVLGMKAVPLALGAVGIGGAVAAVSSFVPVGSMAYLGYSLGRNPIKTLRAAKSSVTDAVAKLRADGVIKLAKEAVKKPEKEKPHA